jgi:NTP pyrophosphatase (non-canonical NTP hydrolase)
MAGFVGDVGDLSKLVMAKANLRHISDVDAKIAHELADCLWSVLVIADRLDVDLEDAFSKTMAELDGRLEV